MQDLEYLSEGLEGRSGNPVAVLFDTLLHPNADFGYEFPPVLQWRRDKQQHLPHLVLGRATPGGAWHVSYSYTVYTLLSPFIYPYTSPMVLGKAMPGKPGKTSPLNINPQISSSLCSNTKPKLRS